MDAEWHHQVRVYLDDPTAELARHDAGDPRLAPLRQVLDRHRAAAVSQLDAFAAYVAEAERAGPDGFALYRWTRATLDDPAKRAQHGRAFAIRIDGRELYDADAADALAADLQPLVGGGLVVALTRHDTNPANAMPVPEQYRG